MNKLPLDVVNIIHSYIPHEWLYVLNIDNFQRFYFEYREKSNQTSPSLFINSYIPYIVKRDLSLCFEIIFEKLYQQFIRIKKFNYKKLSFPDYTDFLLYLIIENKSDRCKEKMITYYNEKGINRKKKYKKIKVKYNKWSN